MSDVVSQQTAYADNSDFNADHYMFQQLLARVATCMLVKVLGVTNTGGLSTVGYVDAQAMVNQVDGADNGTPHGRMHNLPYMRIQGGTNAVIIDPAVGDIGLACFASRDISTVKNTRNFANPGSRRRYSMADGCYIGGFLNGIPTQYIQFLASGINIVSPGTVTIQAPNVSITSPNIKFN